MNNNVLSLQVITNIIKKHTRGDNRSGLEQWLNSEGYELTEKGKADIKRSNIPWYRGEI